jgi:flavin reductase (DIM6/NTAB) family NADH-FMN oxidoreductase RutF
MEWHDLTLEEALPEILPLLGGGGCLLNGSNTEGKVNTMTIGWATFGVIWRKRIATVLVRPSRYTYEFVESVSDFTVNAMPDEYAAALSFCGTKSGRDHNKFRETGLTLAPAREVATPVIAEARIVIECRTLYRHDLREADLPEEVRSACYPNGDYHRLYYGDIVACYGN